MNAYMHTCIHTCLHTCMHTHRYELTPDTSINEGSRAKNEEQHLKPNSTLDMGIG